MEPLLHFQRLQQPADTFTHHLARRSAEMLYRTHCRRVRRYEYECSTCKRLHLPPIEFAGWCWCTSMYGLYSFLRARIRVLYVHKHKRCYLFVSARVHTVPVCFACTKVHRVHMNAILHRNSVICVSLGSWKQNAIVHVCFCRSHEYCSYFCSTCMNLQRFLLNTQHSKRLL